MNFAHKEKSVDIQIFRVLGLFHQTSSVNKGIITQNEQLLQLQAYHYYRGSAHLSENALIHTTQANSP